MIVLPALLLREVRGVKVGAGIIWEVIHTWEQRAGGSGKGKPDTVVNHVYF